MSDPRRPINTFSGDDANEIRKVAYDHLLECTNNGARAIGCTGVSFVLLGLSLWISEIYELDEAAGRKFLVALATLYDSKATPAKKTAAERSRREAVKSILEAVDLDMAETAGTA